MRRHGLPIAHDGDLKGALLGGPSAFTEPTVSTQ